MSRASRTGMRVDPDYFHLQNDELSTAMAECEKALEGTKAGQLWRSNNGAGMSLGNDGQLGKVLFTQLKLKPPKTTQKDGGVNSVDKSVLAELVKEAPFLIHVQEWRRLKKTRDFVLNILREQVNGLLHPAFNLHIAITFRSTSDGPNFQNMPKRDPFMKKVIRSGFLPRPGYVLIEVDYGGLEVRIACCYHEDPRMVQWLTTGYDFHMEYARKSYLMENVDLPDGWWSDKTPGAGADIRYCGKNNFVFPEFYGDFYGNCAQGLWDRCAEMNLHLPDGTPMMAHLKRFFKQLKSATTDRRLRKPLDKHAFETHIYNLERELWDETFPTYRDWKPKFLEQYQNNGYLDLKTGFRIEGSFSTKDVINYPVQGAAFHCLLWSFVRMSKEIARRKMKAKMIGQVHDSILADVPVEEAPAYIELAQRVMTQDIRKAWDWIIVPLNIDVELTKENENWYQMEKLSKTA